MTTDPPDLRTLAAEAIRDEAMLGAAQLPTHEADRYADAVLAAVLPAHWAMVLEEAAAALITADLGPSRDPGWMFADDPVALVRRLATTGPPTDSASTLPGQSSPAVPEATERRSAGCDDCDDVCTEKCTCPGCTAPQADRP